VVVLLTLAAILAPQLAAYDPKEALFKPYHAPTWTMLFGSDHLGRDIYSRVVWGARLSLYVGLASVTVGITLGAPGVLSAASLVVPSITSANALSIRSWPFHR
jgi:ABC-type dipeptide/oligopeptide/nickel transport system permease subunit